MEDKILCNGNSKGYGGGSMTLGKRIQDIRFSYGKTLEEFGLMIDGKAGKSNVLRWENNHNKPNKFRLKRLAELGNMTVDQLLNGGEEMIIGNKIQTFIHTDDVSILTNIYANEMTVKEFIGNMEDYIHSLEHCLLNTQEVSYQLKMEMNDAQKLMANSPYIISDIKKH